MLRSTQCIATRTRQRTLLAWEHGRNLGLISRLLAVAKLIEAQGGEPVWAVLGRVVRACAKPSVGGPVAGSAGHDLKWGP